MDPSDLSPAALLALHAQVADELRARGITRSANGPTGDLAEYLFCEAFGWTKSSNSEANIDVIGPDGTRYQIKGRRITRHNKSRQLSAIRDLGGAHFDFLAGVSFAEDYAVMRVALIPYAVANVRATFVERTNSHRFLLRDDVWQTRGVRDVTIELQQVDFLDAMGHKWSIRQSSWERVYRKPIHADNVRRCTKSFRSWGPARSKKSKSSKISSAPHAHCRRPSLKSRFRYKEPRRSGGCQVLQPSDTGNAWPT